MISSNGKKFLVEAVQNAIEELEHQFDVLDMTSMTVNFKFTKGNSPKVSTKINVIKAQKFLIEKGKEVEE